MSSSIRTRYAHPTHPPLERAGGEGADTVRVSVAVQPSAWDRPCSRYLLNGRLGAVGDSYAVSTQPGCAGFVDSPLHAASRGATRYTSSTGRSAAARSSRAELGLRTARTASQKSRGEPVDGRRGGSYLTELARTEHEEPILVEMEARAAEHGFPIVGRATSRFLELAARAVRARRVMELARCATASCWGP